MPRTQPQQLVAADWCDPSGAFSICFADDISHSACVLEPRLSELIGFVDHSVALVATRRVVADHIAVRFESADDQQMAGGGSENVAGELAGLEVDGGDQGLALGDVRLGLVPVANAGDPRLKPAFAGAGAGAAPVAEDVGSLVIDRQ